MNELPHPPADYTKLADFPVQPKDLVPAEVYRVHQSIYGPEYFSYESEYRWDPTPGMGDEFGSCYTSPQADIAFAEAMGEFVVIPQGEIDKRSISLFELSDELRLADMTSDKLVGKYQLDVRIATGEDYPLCQEWATALRQAGFDGIYYQARHGMSWGTSIASSVSRAITPKPSIASERVRSLMPWSMSLSRRRLRDPAEHPALGSSAARGALEEN